MHIYYFEVSEVWCLHWKTPQSCMSRMVSTFLVPMFQLHSHYYFLQSLMLQWSFIVYFSSINQHSSKLISSLVPALSRLFHLDFQNRGSGQLWMIPARCCFVMACWLMIIPCHYFYCFYGLDLMGWLGRLACSKVNLWCCRSWISSISWSQ